LAKPDEDLFDQGLSFDLDTVIDRRRMLRVLGIGAGAVALAGCGAAAPSRGTTTAAATAATASCAVELPEETAGPYPRRRFERSGRFRRQRHRAS
jgi:hypothetical protein